MHQEALLTDDSSFFLPTRLWPPTPVQPLLETALNGFLVPDSRLWQVNEAWTILEASIITHRPDHIFLLFSGGYDSLVATHLSMMLISDTLRKYASHFGDRLPFPHVLHINTNIGVPETREYVRNVAHGCGWHYLEYTTPESYEATCLRYGFPGPGQHSTMYSRLKERALRLAIRDHTPPHPFTVHQHELYDLLNEIQGFPLYLQYAMLQLIRRYLTKAIKTYHEDLHPIVFITGVRQSESARRMGNVVPMQKHGRHWWLSPLTSWSKDDVLSYRDAHELPHNLVVDLLHKSSECLCGAFAKAGELEELSVWYPTVAAYIKNLEWRVRAAGFGWGWEERPPSHKRLSPLHTGQLLLPGLEEIMEEDTPENLPSPGFSPLCSSCNARFSRMTTRPSLLKADPYLVEKGDS